MQQRTGSFKEYFLSFPESTKTNWLRFTSLLAVDIVNNDIRNLTDASRKNVFIIKEIYSKNKKRRGKLKIENHTFSKSEQKFFGSVNDLKRNYLKIVNRQDIDR